MLSQAQLNTPQPSPTETVKQNFGLSSIELSYSRPGMKGRKVFGDLVPFGDVWRTGANGATTLTFGDDVVIGDKSIPAGKYGLLTIPGESSWTIIITKQTDVTSPAAYKQDQDVVRLQATPVMLPYDVETFSIGFGEIKDSTLMLSMMWENTFVSFPISTEIDSKVMKQIDALMKTEKKPYFQAASYYLNNGKDLNKALGWFNKAIEQQPDAFYIYYQKALTEAKLGKTADAIATAQKSIELSKKAQNGDYVRLNEKLIESLK